MALETPEKMVLGDVSDDGSTAAVARARVHERVEVPKGAELFLRAQLIHRQIQGALPEDLLFVSAKGLMRRKYLADAVRAGTTRSACR